MENMERGIITIESENLDKEVDIAVYGHFGSTLLLFSTFDDDALENEQNGLIEAIAPFIKKGKIRIFSVPTANNEIWKSESITPHERSKRHFNYNNFIVEEVLPVIYDSCGSVVPIITVGADHGAYQAVNSYFRRPDLFLGTIGMSGFYNIGHLTQGYFDDNCYFNSPVHYLPNLNDNYWLTFLKSRHHVYLLSGKGDAENPSESLHLSSILQHKGIPHQVDIWGEEWAHNFDTWKTMLAQYINKKL